MGRRVTVAVAVPRAPGPLRRPFAQYKSDECIRPHPLLLLGPTCLYECLSSASSSEEKGQPQWEGLVICGVVRNKANKATQRAHSPPSAALSVSNFFTVTGDVLRPVCLNCQ